MHIMSLSSSEHHRVVKWRLLSSIYQQFGPNLCKTYRINQLKILFSGQNVNLPQRAFPCVVLKVKQLMYQPFVSK